MKAMVLHKPRTPLEWTELPERHPGPGEIRVKVLACGVCRTDLHVVDGELPDVKSPIIPGHEIVGRIDEIGQGVTGLKIGERVGIPWLGHVDGTCPYCLERRENLCDHPLFTGYTRDGGFATATIADARFAFPLGETGSDVRTRASALRRIDRLALSDHRGPRQEAGNSTASEPLATSLRRLRDGRAGTYTPSRGPETLARKSSPKVLARSGLAAPTRRRPRRWTRRSSMRQSALSRRWRCKR